MSLFPKVLYRLCVVALIGCAINDKQEVPKGTLPMSKMAAILADIHLAEAAVALQGLTFQDALSRYDHYEREIMRRHQTDTATYRQSYQFYASNSQYLADLMKQVTDTLYARKKIIEQKDSILTAPATNTTFPTQQ
ncbi:MAG: DUF4296 domain-containing protein [Cytophagales bacterium]|nr:DUF4296 domain-containing protein [Bernardetiaceae bacterium]MDW8204410.1 DUF4296 domain-containing protein [Cytophagales bacterium]